MSARNHRPRTLSVRSRLNLEHLEDRSTPATVGAGDPDPGFGAGGLVTVPFNMGGTGEDEVTAMVVQPDGKIILAGSVDTGAASGEDFAVARLLPDGRLDPSFGAGGRWTYGFNLGRANGDRVEAVALLPDGKILLAGRIERASDGDCDFGVVRLLSNGTLDMSFGWFGRSIVWFDLGGDNADFLESMAVQSDGKIVLAGTVKVVGDFDFGVARLLANGDYDTSFNGDGKLIVPFDLGGNRDDWLGAVTVQSDGRIVLVGTANMDHSPQGHSQSAFAVARLLPNGDLDPSFNGSGKQTVRFDLSDISRADANAVALQPDGKIILVGEAQIGWDSGDDFAVARLLSDGRLDPSFSGDGRQTVGFDLGIDPSIRDDFGREVALQPDGKVIVAGIAFVSWYPLGGGSSFGIRDFAAVRLLPNGERDPTFGDAGRRTLNLARGGAGDDYAAAVAVQPDGMLLIAGSAEVSGNIPLTHDFAVVRLGSGPPAPPAAPRAPLAVGGATDGSARLYAPSGGGYATTSAAPLAPFGAVPANVRTVTADVNGDTIPDTVLVTGPGTPIRVAVVSGADNATLLVAPFDPFGGDFGGGGFVTAADFDRDGRTEFVVTPDQGGGPRISIFSLTPTGGVATRANFITIEENFRGGCRPGAGDINRDGVPDLAVSAGFLGGPRIVLLDGTKLFTTDGLNPADKLVNDFFAYSELLRNGAYVAVGDVDGDGFGDLIFGAGPGGGPEIRIASGQTLLAAGSDAALSGAIADFFLAGDLSNRGGVRVAVKDADGDSRADVVAGTGGGQASFARVYLGKDFVSVAEPATFQDLDPFGGAVLADGVYVG